MPITYSGRAARLEAAETFCHRLAASACRHRATHAHHKACQSSPPLSTHVTSLALSPSYLTPPGATLRSSPPLFVACHTAPVRLRHLIHALLKAPVIKFIVRLACRPQCFTQCFPSQPAHGQSPLSQGLQPVIQDAGSPPHRGAASSLCRANARTCSMHALAGGFAGPSLAGKGGAMQALGRGLPGAVHQLPCGGEVEGVTAAGVAAAGDRAGQLPVHADRLLLGGQARQAQPGQHLLGTRALSAPAENACIAS